MTHYPAVALICTAPIFLGSCAQTPPDWHAIKLQEDNAFKQYRDGSEACFKSRFDRELKELTMHVEEGNKPDPDWGLVHKQNLDEMVDRCDVEAAARLKTQLWSP